MSFMTKKTQFQDLYAQYAGAVSYITVEDKNGDEGIGSAFHIGSGIFVTAKHVIENNTIKEIATTKRIEIVRESEFEDGNPTTLHIYPRVLEITGGPFYDDTGADVAVFRIAEGEELLPKIKLGSHVDHDIDDNEFILSNTLVIGYPPIPFTTTPNQVVAKGHVNAVIDIRNSSYVHFVISSIARGGFSGGVVLSEDGFALGLVTESLVMNHAQTESGFMCVLSIEAAVYVAEKFLGFNLAEHGVYRDEYTLIEFKMVNPTLSRLNSRIYNACVCVYDDDRDVFVELNCNDEAILSQSFEAFNSVAPINLVDSLCNENKLFSLLCENPTAELLLIAARAARDVFEQHGYEEKSTKQNTWQLK